MGVDPFVQMADEDIFDMEEGDESPSSSFHVSPLKRQLAGVTDKVEPDPFEKVQVDRRVSSKHDASSSPKQGRRSLLGAELKRAGGADSVGNEGNTRQQTRRGIDLRFDRVKRDGDAGNDSSEDEEFHQRMRDRQRMLRAANNSLEGSSMLSASLPANIDRTRAKYFRSLNLLPQQGGAGGGRDGGIDEDAVALGAVPVATGASRTRHHQSSSQPISINTTGVDDDESGSEHDDGVDPTFVPPHKLIARGCFSVADVQVKPKKFGQL